MDIDKKDQPEEPENEVDEKPLTEQDIVTATCALIGNMTTAALVVLDIFLGWVQGFLDEDDMLEGFDVIPDHTLQDAAHYELEERGVVELIEQNYKWKIPEKDRQLLEEAFFTNTSDEISLETQLFNAIGYAENPWETLAKQTPHSRAIEIMERVRKARAAKATEPKPEDNKDEV
jgi:hypothetical protein